MGDCIVAHSFLSLKLRQKTIIILQLYLKENALNKLAYY